MNRQIENVGFNSIEKVDIRELIGNCVDIGEEVLDLYGFGSMYAHCKERGTGVYSIDTGKDFNNKEYMKNALTGPNRRYISIIELAKEGTKQFQVIWLDYCGFMSRLIEKDLWMLSRLMKNKGYFFITLQQKRERICRKGTSRKTIDSKTMNIIRDILRTQGVELVYRVMKEKYISRPDYIGRGNVGGSPMITIGFKYKKT